MSIMSLKEFSNTSSIATELLLTLKALADAHPIIANLPIVQKVLNSTDSHFVIFGIVNVLRAMLQKSVEIALTATYQTPETQLLLVSDQNLLIGAAIVLSAALSAQALSSLDKETKE